MALKESFAGQSSILDPMRIDSLLFIPKIRCHSEPYSTETSNGLDHVYYLNTRTSKSNSQPGSTHSKQVQLSHLSHVSSTTTNETSHISNNNGPNHKYNDEELWFIWYKRAALDQQWNVINESFNRQFPGRKLFRGRTLRHVYYRLIERIRSLVGENISAESILHRAKLPYSWISIPSSEGQFSDLPHIPLATISAKRSISMENCHGRGYTKEEIWFLWWKHVALEKPWDDILESFNCEFPNRRRDHNGGMRSKLRREIGKSLPSLSQIKDEAGASHLDKVTSFITRANVSYPWMLKALETAQSSS